MSGSAAAIPTLSAFCIMSSTRRVKHLVRLWMRPYPIDSHRDRLVHYSSFCHASNKRHRPRSRQFGRNRHFGGEIKCEWVLFYFGERHSRESKIQVFVYHQVESNLVLRRIVRSTGVWSPTSSQEELYKSVTDEEPSADSETCTWFSCGEEETKSYETQG